MALVDYNTYKPTKKQKYKLDYIWNIFLPGLKNQSRRRGEESEKEWENGGIEFKESPQWKFSLNSMEFEIAAGQLSSLLGQIGKGRDGYLTPIKSVESMKKSEVLHKEHVFMLIFQARKIIFNYLKGKIKSKEELFKDYIYKYSATVITTETENKKLKDICLEYFRNECEGNYKNLEKFSKWMYEFNHYAQLEIQLVHPENISELSKTKTEYHYDLITSEMKEYCNLSIEEINDKAVKNWYEKVDEEIEIEEVEHTFW